MGNLNIPPEQWLKEQFEYERCSECGGDAEHHVALPILGNWFAQCKYPRDEEGELHIEIKRYLLAKGLEENPDAWDKVAQELNEEILKNFRSRR